MATLLSGIMAGIAAAIFMGAASEIAYRMGLFNSSLLLIDGSFFLRFTRKESGKGDYLAGIPVHHILLRAKSFFTGACGLLFLSSLAFHALYRPAHSRTGDAGTKGIAPYLAGATFSSCHIWGWLLLLPRSAGIANLYACDMG
jgi:hypothetical protein